jgi:putative N6-adenine-specific DNA methylase
MTLEYQRANRYFALAANELHQMAAEELQSFGCSDVKSVYRGVYFVGDKAGLYRANYGSRFISKILAPIASFRCVDKDELYKQARMVKWDALMSLDTTFAIFATVSNSGITHSQYASLVLKDAIVDQFRDKYKKRPNVDPADPDIWYNLHIDRDRATISFDTSGGPLHKRGYRRIQVEAPMMETLAAGIIRFTEWDGEKPLYDPMCGGGTLLAEALMRYCRVPPGVLRKRFGLERLPDFDAGLWAKVKADANGAMRPLPGGLIRGSDLSKEATSAAQINLSTVPEAKGISLETADFRDLDNLENSVIVCNPPYGLRLDKEADIGRFYGEFGDFLKQRCRGSTAWVYLGVKELIPALGLKPSRKIPLSNGALDGRLVKIEVY